jgi:hypothetical protein
VSVEEAEPDGAARSPDAAGGTGGASRTKIVRRTRGKAATFVLPKPLSELRREDVVAMQAELRRRLLGRHPILGRLFLFAGWWFAFTGLYAMNSVCPFCGNVGCVVGVASAGIFGAVCAGGVAAWSRITHACRHACRAVRSRFAARTPT